MRADRADSGGEAWLETLADAEEAVVRAHELWRRSPGTRRWPFAGDAPWHLMRPEVGDIVGATSETLIDAGGGKVVQALKVETLRPRAALDAAEVSERDRVTGWLELIADPVDRRIVWAACACLARGDHGPGGRISWGEVKARVGWQRTTRALAFRYVAALAELVCAVRGWPLARRRALAAAGIVRPDAG